MMFRQRRVWDGSEHVRRRCSSGAAPAAATLRADPAVIQRRSMCIRHTLKVLSTPSAMAITKQCYAPTRTWPPLRPRSDWLCNSRG